MSDDDTTNADRARPLTKETIGQMLDQIGHLNVLSISGGRTQYNVRNSQGEALALDLPVSSGYKVRIYHDATDTYTVERVMVRGSKTFFKGEIRDVYAEEIGEVAYRAGMYKSFDFGVPA